MLRLEQLNYLRMVVRCNSIKIAAETLNVVPSTISTSLHKMEDEIGISLLVRTYRGIEVTDAAREIAEKAEEIFGSMRDIDDIIYRYGQLAEKTVNNDTAFTLYFSRGYYQGSLDRILNQCEMLGLQVDCPDFSRGNEGYLEKVNINENAILINFFVEPANELLEAYENVVFYRLKTSKPAVIYSKRIEHMLPNTNELTIEEALKLPYLMFMEGYDLALPIYEMLEQNGPLNIAAKYANMSVMQTMLYRGKGFSVTCEQGMLKQESIVDESMSMVPIRSDMRISLIMCYNRNMNREKKKLLDQLIPIFL
ncbi:MAG: LysR family transcriptional regulator [Peptococcaceae bacterium]|nr:LysR family transcriptional regulator [Peptococcaceae bacterium]